MSILFVLLTFLLILTVMYFRRPDAAANVVVAPAKKLGPAMAKQGAFDVPQGYCFHPGHTWVVDEGHQNARVGIDSFAANLFGSDATTRKSHGRNASAGKASSAAWQPRKPIGSLSP